MKKCTVRRQEMASVSVKCHELPFHYLGRGEIWGASGSVRVIHRCLQKMQVTWPAHSPNDSTHGVVKTGEVQLNKKHK